VGNLNCERGRDFLRRGRDEENCGDLPVVRSETIQKRGHYLVRLVPIRSSEKKGPTTREGLSRLREVAARAENIRSHGQQRHIK